MSIVFINHNKDLFYCQDNRCLPLQTKIKDEPVVATIDPKKVVTHSFKIPLNMSEDELKIEVEMRLFDEAGLNANEEYKIDYIIKEKNIEETENIVEAFAVRESDLDKEFKHLLPKVKHIDLISIPYVAYQGLYERKILEPKNDVFLQLDKDMAFIVLCSEGKYIYARPINDLSMLCSGIDDDFGLDTEAYIQILQKKGLKQSAYNDDEKELLEIIQSQFQAIYNRINDTIMYNRNIFGFEKADRIFVDCANGWIEGIDEFLHDMMFEQAQILSTRESLNLQCNDLNTYDCICAEYEMLHLKIKPNLTIYERKKPFAQTFFAKILYTAATAMVLSAAYPLYLWYANQNLEQNILKSENMLTSKQKQQMQYAKQIKELQSQIDSTNETLKNLEKDYEQLISKVKGYWNLQKQNEDDLLFINNTAQSLRKYKLHITSIGKDNDSYFVSIYTAYESRDLVTKLMNEFLRLGYSSVETDKIYTQDGKYNCTVKIAL